MSSNKSIVASKKTISRTMFSDLLKKNKDINSLKSNISNNEIRCKLLNYTLIRLQQQIDNFDELYSKLDIIKQQKLIDRLEKETRIIHDKYNECIKIDESLEYALDELIMELSDKYNIVNPKTPVMVVSKNAGNTKQKHKRKHKRKHKDKYKLTRRKNKN